MSGTRGDRDQTTPDALEREFEDIRAWLECGLGNANPRSRIIVTSRTATIAGFLVEVTRLKEEDATNLINQHVHAIMLRRRFGDLSKPTLKKILDFTLGNPLAIRLCLGLLNGTGNEQSFNKAVETVEMNQNPTIEPRHDILIRKMWEELKEDEMRIVEALVIFPIGEWIPVSLLIQAAGGGERCELLKDVPGLREFWLTRVRRRT